MIEAVSILGRQLIVEFDDQNEWIYRQAVTGDWEADTFSAIARFVDVDWTYIDIGAWIGAMTIFASQTAKRSVAVEPDPVAASQLLRSVARNPGLVDKVEIWTIPIAEHSGATSLHSAAFGNSMTSILTSRGQTTLSTMAIGATEFIDIALATVDGPTFFKIDIEGAEFSIVPRLVNKLLSEGIQGAIHLSLHSHFLNGGNEDTEAWVKNVRDTSIALAALADFGEFYSWDGSDWKPSRETGVNPLLQESWSQFGGMATTVLVASLEMRPT